MTAYGDPTLAASASPRVRDLVRGPRRTAPVVHRGPHAVYLDLDGWCLGLVAATAVAVPNALVLPRESLGTLTTARSAVVGEGALQLQVDAGSVGVRVGRLRDVTVPRLRHLPADALLSAVRRRAAVADAELADLDLHGDHLPGDHLPVDDLVGRGSGLTPLGDDVLAGWTATGVALGARACLPDDLARRTTLLSATLLECAAHGEVLPAFAAIVRALTTGCAATVEHAADALAATGHTSGSGLLLGACLRLEAARAAIGGRAA